MKKLHQLYRQGLKLIDKSQTYFNPFDKPNEKFRALILATILYAIASGLGFLANFIDIYWLQILIAIIAGLIGIGFATGLMLAISGWLSSFCIVVAIVCFILFENKFIPKDMDITFHYFYIILFIINVLIVFFWTIILKKKSK